LDQHKIKIKELPFDTRQFLGGEASKKAKIAQERENFNLAGYIHE